MLIAKKSLRLALGLLFILLVNGAGAGVMNIAALQDRGVIKKGSLIVFLVTEDPNNYNAHVTIPVFADLLTKKYGYNTRVLLGEGPSGACRFPDMKVLAEADLLVVFSRRIALPHAQMQALKDYLASGKPLIGIRTANHAFTVNGQIEKGYEDWPGFVSEILGCKNRGYGPVTPGTEVSVVASEWNHTIAANIGVSQWHSNGNVYLVKPLLDTRAKILLTGKAEGLEEPVAWTRMAGDSKIFYTSLGYPDDFKTPEFTTLLVNAVKWALAGNLIPKLK